MREGTTTARTIPRLVWSLWALSVMLSAFALLLLVLDLNHPGIHVYDYRLETTLGALLFSTVGAIVGSCRPQNPGRKYDASRTLEYLATKLRNETDLGALSGDILTIMRDTMQPEHASLWLRDHLEEAPLEIRS